MTVLLKRVFRVSLSPMLAFLMIFSAMPISSVYARNPIGDNSNGVKLRQPVKSDSRARARHLLNRIAYGPRRSDIDVVLSKGWESYLSEQLNPDSIAMPEQLKMLSQK